MVQLRKQLQVSTNKPSSGHCNCDICLISMKARDAIHANRAALADWREYKEKYGHQNADD